MLYESDSNGISDSMARSQAFTVLSLDCKQNKILVSMAMGEIWEYEVVLSEDKIANSKDLGSSAHVESDDNEDIADESGNNSQHLLTQKRYCEKRKKLLSAHSSQCPDPDKKYVVFDTHHHYPIFVSAATDARLIFRDLNTNEVVATYTCERNENVRVRSIKFAPLGLMLIVGLTTGTVMTFCMEVGENSLGQVGPVELKHFQTFKNESGPYFQVICIEFSEKGEMFAASYVQDPSFKRQKTSDPEDVPSFIRIYRIKTERNRNMDEAFYEAREIIRVRDEESNVKTVKCAVGLHF